jgi:hypothetical protein
VSLQRGQGGFLIEREKELSVHYQYPVAMVLGSSR